MKKTWQIFARTNISITFAAKSFQKTKHTILIILQQLIINMKEFYLIRHAKSSWEDFRIRDFDRPLNERGHRAAPCMASFLKNLNITPDILISSPALRAITTCEYFARTFDYPKDKILKVESIYEALVENLYEVIHSIDNQHDTVFLFGHNPSISSFSDSYLEDFIPEVPTCGVVKFESSAKTWQEFTPSTAKFVAMWEPKKVFAEVI